MPDPTLLQRAQTLEPGTRIELFDADFRPFGGEIYFFHNYPVGGSGIITWKGNDYIPRPLKVEGWEYKADGPRPTPHLFISNIDGIISSLCRQFNDCHGVVVTRHVTYEEFLDGKPGADPTQEFDPDVFKIEQKMGETNEEVEFELKSPEDAEGAQIPRRQVIAPVCRWVFRGPDCGYAGAPKTDSRGNLLAAVTDRGLYDSGTTYAVGDYAYVLIGGIRLYWVSLVNANNFSLNTAGKWVRSGCSHRLGTGCKPHFGAAAPLPFGGFPGTATLPNVQ